MGRLAGRPTWEPKAAQRVAEVSEEAVGRRDNSRAQITTGGPDSFRGKELGLRGSQRRPVPYYTPSGCGSTVWEFSLRQNEPKILVDSQEEASSETTE